MTSPRDETRYTFKVDERDASRGLKKLAEGMEDVDKQSAKLRKSQTLQADAAGKLRVAESRLADLRQTGKAKASQLAQAEESVAAARRKLVDASDDARRSSLALGRAQESNRRTSLLAARAQENARQATTSLATAQDGATRSSGRLHRAQNDTRQATTSLSRAQDGAVGSSGRLRRATGSTVTGFVSARKSVGGLSLGIGSLLGPVGLMAGAATAAGLAFAGVFVAGLKGFVDEARESQKVGRLTTAVIKSTGGAAKVSATQVSDLAESISTKVGVDDEAIQSAENLLLCLEESAQALTRDRGWVTHDRLSIGDEVLTYDPIDDTSRWEPILDFYRYQVDTELIHWKSKQIDVKTTPHHRWWTEGTSGVTACSTRTGFMTTEEISGHQIKVRIGGGKPGGFRTNPVLSDDIVELLGWVTTEGWFVKWADQSKATPWRPRLCGICESAPARNRSGWPRCDACAQGPIQSGRTTPRPKVTAETSRMSSVSFSQSQTANPKHVARIRELVDRLVHQGHTISETQYVARYNDSVISEWHFSGALGREVRRLLPDKKLTPELLGMLTEQQAELLLDTLIDGDGHIGPNGDRQYIQKDTGQLDVLAMLCAMLGVRTSVLGRGGDCDSLYLCKTNRLYGHRVHAERIRYVGVVWCPQVRTGIFMARNAGRTFWTGNTFTKVRNEAGKGNDIFNQATFAVADMAAAMNGGVVTAEGMRSTTVRLGKALQDPIKGTTALSKAGVVFTDQQKQQIKTLVESGRTLDAQKIILAELRKEFGGAAAAGADPIMRMQVAWANFKETVGLAVLPVVERLSAYLADKLPGAAQKTASFVTATLVPALTGIGEGFRHVREQVGPVSLGLASFNTGVRDMGAAASGVAATVAPIGDVLTKVKLGGEGAGKALGPIGDLLIGLGGSAGGATAALEPMGDLLKTNNRGAEEFGKKVGAALRTLVDWSFKGAIGLVNLGEQGALGLASILEGFASVSIGMGNFLKDTYGTLTGVLGGFKILAKAIAPALVPKIEESERAMREFGQKAGQSLVDSGNKAKGMADSIRRNVPPAAAAAKAKLEDMRKSALGIPKSTLTRLDVAERMAQQKIAATKRQLQDPALTATRKAKLEADLRKWQAQLAQIQRDKARAAQAVRIPTGATAMPSRVIVVREKDRNGIITGIRFAGRGAFATGGRVFGAGTETSDSIPARLSKGEHVWTAREVRGAGGHSVVERMRKQAARAPGYATGGMVRAEDGSLVPASFYDPPPSGMVRAEDGSLVPKSFYGSIPLGYAKTRAQTRSGLKSAADAGLRAAVMSVMRDALKREGTGAFSPGLIGALNFAKAQVGSLYAWGKQGPRSVGYDCSGFQSAITRTARGQSPYVRLGSTASFPWSGFARGPGAYMIGSTPDAGGGIGHMAGTLNGVNVESRGGEGVVVGPRARGARAGLFGGNVWHLRGFARGGRVGDPPFDLLDRRGKHYQAELAEMLMAAKRFGVRSYDQGGRWPNGTLGVNTSGGTETVLPPGPQRLHPADIQALGEVIGRVVVGGIRSNDVAVGRTADLILRGG